jgi:hypothetical protein
MKLFIYITAIVVFFAVNACQKEKLPRSTQEGKNTFGCKVNGKNWVPKGGGPFSGINPTYGGFWYGFNQIYVEAYDKDETIQIYLRNMFSTGEYSLNFNTIPQPDNLYPDNYALYSKGKGPSANTYITTSEHTGKVFITKRDTVNSIISGSFHFNAVNKRTGEVIKVTEGRFDIKTH